MDRLGTPASSLLERRTDAEEWARAARERTAPAWVPVRVERAGTDRYRLRVWCDEGSGPRRPRWMPRPPARESKMPTRTEASFSVQHLAVNS
ncbi:hypothetical protein [Streptomyces sp. NPDC088816]|uniref:hypothetical protein n=1 Tax=unclassified Streptomyces TaxID=2593676 RepID=UPI0037F53239